VVKYKTCIRKAQPLLDKANELLENWPVKPSNDDDDEDEDN